MKRLFTILTALMITVGMSGAAFAQHGKGQSGGKPATTGLEHAETKANAHGERGIEKAETKQAAHKKKHKKHHHSHA